MSSSDDQTEPSKPHRTTGRIISSGSAGRVAQTFSSHVDEIPFIPAIDLLEAKTALSEPEVALIAATLWAETSPAGAQGSSRWLTAARILAVSQRL